jgi:nitric oxide reductase activation protein
VRIVKTWAEPFGAPVLSRLAALEPIGSTRTGAALRHAVQALAAEPSEHKLLLVVTDGYPQDTDYGPASAGVAYGVADTAHALQEARALGIMTYCIAIDPAGEDYLRDACASDQYLQLDDVAALPQRLAAVYQALVV